MNEKKSKLFMTFEMLLLRLAKSRRYSSHNYPLSAASATGRNNILNLDFSNGGPANVIILRSRLAFGIACSYPGCAYHTNCNLCILYTSSNKHINFCEIVGNLNAQQLQLENTLMLQKVLIRRFLGIGKLCKNTAGLFKLS